MKAPNGSTLGHSADVRMQLFVNGHILPIAQLGPDFLILRSPVEHGPCEAQISLSIDGNESSWPVRLDNGIRTDQLKTAISTPINNA